MRKHPAMEQVEEVMRKITWAQEILSVAQENTTDAQLADIISGVTFIINSASSDAERAFNALL